MKINVLDYYIQFFVVQKRLVGLSKMSLRGLGTILHLIFEERILKTKEFIKRLTRTGIP